MSHFEGKLAPLKFLFANLRSLRLHSLNKRKFAFLTVSSVSCPKLFHPATSFALPSYLLPFPISHHPLIVNHRLLYSHQPTHVHNIEDTAFHETNSQVDLTVINEEHQAFAFLNQID